MDRISNLPLSLLETILCLLPYHEVVRTSTLSKEWRYHWTNVTKIVVIEDTRTLNRIKLLSGVSQALLMHKGPIHELTLSIAKDDHWGFDTAIRRIISHLSSKKAVKKLTVDFGSRGPVQRFYNLKDANSFLLGNTYKSVCENEKYASIKQCFTVKAGIDGFLDIARRSFCDTSEEVAYAMGFSQRNNASDFEGVVYGTHLSSIRAYYEGARNYAVEWMYYQRRVASEPKVRLKRKKEEVGCVEDKQRMDAVKEKAIEAINALIS
ncbi:F-box/FBD/LRR-repeat protein-like protein [Tanacetum coccineum]